MKILVLGWYGHFNLGDEAFRPVIQNIVGEEVTLYFRNSITSLQGYDALIVGGGSFLDTPLHISSELIDTNIPIVFLGVGIHEKIADANLPWLAKAKMVVCRNRYGNAYQGDNVIYAPDLVFARKVSSQSYPIGKRLLILGSGFAVPKPTSLPWQVESWNTFESVMGKVIDHYVDNGWIVSMQPMCADPEKLHAYDDRQANFQMAQMSTSPQKVEMGFVSLSEQQVFDEIASSSLILSLKFHGCIFPAILGRPFVGITSHDKTLSFFKDNSWENYVNYYGMTKQTIADAVKKMPSLEEFNILRERGYDAWQGLRDSIRTALSM